MTSNKTKLRQFVTAIFAAFNKSTFRRILVAIFAACTIFLVSAPVAAQPFDNVWHVDDDAAPGGNGLSWNTPFDNLQDALDEADDAQIPLGSDLIKVAQGLYIPTVRTNPANARSVTFELNGSNFNNITIRGGYAGINEMNPDRRNVNLYVTTLSGAIDDPFEDVCGNPGDGDCVQEGGNGSAGCDDTCGPDPDDLCPGCCTTVCELDPACCVIVWDETCALIATDNCDGSEVPYGAYHVVTFRDVDNTVEIRGVTITAGSAGGSGAASRGGGVFIRDASPAVIRCTITNNAAGAAFGDGEGGGMHITGSSDVAIVNCTFSENFGAEGGALHLDQGVASATLVNCLFFGNDATDHGGAIDVGSDDPAFFDVINCTFVYNSVSGGQGGAIQIEEPELPIDGPDVLITNSILWFNTPDQIDQPGGELDVRYSNVQGTWAGTANIDDEPDFGPGEDNYRMVGGSPGVEEGNNADVPCDQFDLDGNGEGCFPDPLQDTPDLDLRDRVVDGDEDMTPTVDMGAYEFAQCPWDLDGNCVVGASDLLALLMAWGPCADCGNCPADFNDSCDVGASDLLALLANWGLCTCGTVEPMSLADELAAACLSNADWQDFLDALGNGTPVKQENYICWLTHYFEDCNRCICSGLSGCPGADPFN